MDKSNELTMEKINEVIALFMGGKPVQHNKKYRFITWPKWHATPVLELNYHKDWSRLMPVVEKIESLENSRFGFTIDVLHVVVTDYKGKEVEIIWVHKFPDNGDTKISMTYDAVYQFIQWYNQNKPNAE
jgi:hypothetical protein